MTKSDLWKLGVADIIAATRSGERSATDIVEAAIDRMDQVNPALNAVVMDLSNEARQRAAALDRARASGAALGPLHGVPVTIKVNVDQTGWATTNGITALANLVAASAAAGNENSRRHFTHVLEVSPAQWVERVGFQMVVPVLPRWDRSTIDSRPRSCPRRHR